MSIIVVRPIVQRVNLQSVGPQGVSGTQKRRHQVVSSLDPFVATASVDLYILTMTSVMTLPLGVPNGHQVEVMVTGGPDATTVYSPTTFNDGAVESTSLSQGETKRFVYDSSLDTWFILT
jgi:hypothetical protein